MPFAPSSFMVESSKIIRDFFGLDSATESKRPLALDIACGNGRHSLLLAQMGFSVEAIDISSVALEFIANKPHITPILADFDNFALESSKYALVLNSLFLDRRLFPQMLNALQKRAMVLFETFIDVESSAISSPRALYNGELESIFSKDSGFEVVQSNICHNDRENSQAKYPYTIQFIAQKI